MCSDLLPSFEHPPVRETVLGVQFDTLPNFTIAHLGAFWKRLGKEWSEVEEAPFLESQFEEFTETGRWKVAPKLTVSARMKARIKIANRSRDRMVQLQNGRFHFNWMGSTGDDYPRYKAVKPEFEELYSQFRQFLSDEGIGALTENQWEVTYVNPIPQGDLWRSVREWQEVFLPASAVPASVGGTVIWSTNGEITYDIEPAIGRLRVQYQHARKAANEGPEMLVISLTARGSVGKSGGIQSAIEGLDIGRKAIVQGFYGLTSQRAHESWGEIH